jgi:hypothetical protein
MHCRHRFPCLKRRHCLGQRNQELVAAYTAHLQARQDAPTGPQTTIDAVKSFCVLLPTPLQLGLHQDVTHPAWCVRIKNPRPERRGFFDCHEFRNRPTVVLPFPCVEACA